MQVQVVKKSQKRRKVVSRTLNALGHVSVLSGFLNDPKRLDEITSKFEFTTSIEEAKTVEKELKERVTKQKELENTEKEIRKQVKTQKREEKFRSDMDLVRQKVGVGDDDLMLSEHVVNLNGAQ